MSSEDHGERASPAEKQTAVVKLATAVESTTECQQHADGSSVTDEQKSAENKKTEKNCVGASLVGAQSTTGPVQPIDG